MRIFLVYSRAYRHILREENVPILINYAYLGRKGNIKIPPGFPSILIDSGGYQLQVKVSAVREPRIDAYSFWLENEVLPKHKEVVNYMNLDIFSLDMIGKPIKEKLDSLKRSAESTLKNQEIMENKFGLKPIPIWHAGEPEEHFKHYCENYDYVAIGGIASLGTPSKSGIMNLLAFAMQKYPNVKFHLFGIGISGLLAFKSLKPYCLPDYHGNSILHYDFRSTLPSQVKVGDKLIGFDGEKFIPTTVREVFVREATELLLITYERDAIDGRLISSKVMVTPEHPFYTINKGWIEAKELEMGDELLFYHPQWYKTLKSGLRGRKRTAEVSKKISQSIQANEEFMAYLHNRPNPMFDPKVAEKVSKKLKGRKTGDRIPNKVKRREMVRKAWETMKRRPSSLEILAESLIQEYALPIKYVGNGKLWIGNKNDEFHNPDFVVIGRSKVIEIFDSRWPPRKDGYQNEMVKHYKKYGYSCLMIDVCGKSKKEIANDLIIFCSNGATVTKIEKLTGKTTYNRGSGKLSYPYKVYNFYCEPINNFVLNYVLVHNSIDFSTWNVPARFGHQVIEDDKQLLKEIKLPVEERDKIRQDDNLEANYLRETIRKIKKLESDLESYQEPYQHLLF